MPEVNLMNQWKTPDFKDCSLNCEINSRILRRFESLMLMKVLGAAAGAGLPQWNCACPTAKPHVAVPSRIAARTQSQFAIRADDRFRGDRWVSDPCCNCERKQIREASVTGPACHLNPHHDTLVRIVAPAPQTNSSIVYCALF
jgi:hypothetical protein